MPKRGYDVVVVGGGIVGLACAYRLATDGVGTLLLERGLFGGEQTVRTGGGIRLCHSSAINTQLSLLSLPFWEGFGKTFGSDPQFRRTGHLFLSRNESSVGALKEHTGIHQALGVQSEMLDCDEMNRRWQGLNLHEYAAGLHCEVGGYLNHYRVVQGYYHGATAAGAHLRVGERVTGLVKSDDRVVGVETTDGAFHCDHVVNCAGAFAGQIASMAGLDLLIISRRHELLIVQPEHRIPDTLPWLIDIDEQVHLRPDGQGRAMVGGFLGEDPIVDPQKYDPRYDETWAINVRTAAADAFGLIEPSAAIVDGWAGLYAGTPDYHPVIECSCPGLIAAAGFSGTGLMHAPAVGTLVSELVRHGEAKSLDISELNSSRFAEIQEARDSSGF